MKRSTGLLLILASFGPTFWIPLSIIKPGTAFAVPGFLPECNYYEELLKQPDPEAKRVTTALELYCTGSLNLFSHCTNVKTNARVLCVTTYWLLQLSQLLHLSSRSLYIDKYSGWQWRGQVHDICIRAKLKLGWFPYFLAKTLSYIFVDHFLGGLYNETNKGRNPFVRT